LGDWEIGELERSGVGESAPWSAGRYSRRVEPVMASGHARQGLPPVSKGRERFFLGAGRRWNRGRLTIASGYLRSAPVVDGRLLISECRELGRSFALGKRDSSAHGEPRALPWAGVSHPVGVLSHDPRSTICHLPSAIYHLPSDASEELRTGEARFIGGRGTQGVALGWGISPRWGSEPRSTIHHLPSTIRRFGRAAHRGSAIHRRTGNPGRCPGLGYLTPLGFRAAIHDPRSTIYHLPSTIHHPPSTIHHPPSTIYHLPSTIHHPPSTIHHPPSTIHHPPSTIGARPRNLVPSALPLGRACAYLRRAEGN
jgi:hypothetical protein